MALRETVRKISKLRIAAATLFIGAAVGGAVVLSGPGDPAPDADALGARLFEAGEYRRAAEALRLAMREAPSEERRMMLARALFAAGDYPGAIDALADPAGRAPPARTALRAEALARLGRYDEARDVAPDVTAAFPGRFSLIAARALHAQGDMAAAERELASALRHGGDALAEAWLFRARLALERGAHDEARAAARRAGEAGASARAVAAVEVEAMIREGRLDDARARLAPPGRPPLFGPRRKPRNDPQTDYLLAMADAAGGGYAKAARRLRALEQHLAQDPRGRLVLAAVKLGAGDAAQAEALYRDARRAAPRDPVALDALAAFLSRTGRTDEALAVAGALETAAPRLGRLRRLAILESAGETDRLVEAARAVRDAGPATAFASTAIFGAASDAARRDHGDRRRLEALAAAGAARASGEVAAIAAALEGIRQYTDDPAAAVLAGDMAVLLGVDGEARTHYAAAAALAPSAWAPCEGLARLDIRAGDVAAARGRLGDAQTDERGEFKRRLMLARALAMLGEAGRALEALSPVAGRLAVTGESALLYAGLLAEAGDPASLDMFAAAVRRASPASLHTAQVLTLAGRDAEAAAAARRALAGAPGDERARAVYLAAMQKIDRAQEAEDFLSAMARAHPPGSAPPKESVSLEAARGAYGGDPGDARSALQYGTLLEQAENPQSGPVLREACFLGAVAACRPLQGEET